METKLYGEIQELADLAKANQYSEFNAEELFKRITTDSDNIYKKLVMLSMDFEKIKRKYAKADQPYYRVCDTKEVEEGLREVKVDFDSLEMNRRELICKLKTILGFIYDGPLININGNGGGGISVRKNKFYRFRHRYELELKQVLDDIIANKEEVIGKIKGLDEQKILAYVFEVFSKLEKFSNADELIKTPYIEQIPKINLIRPDILDDGTGNGKFYKVDNIRITGRELRFYYSENEQSLNTELRQLLEIIYSKQIRGAMDKFIDAIKIEQKSVSDLLIDINTKYAKHLVYSQMVEK
jgi:hypothetical protein